MRRTAALLIILAVAAPAGAHHTATPAVVLLTSSGDNTLPRLPAFGSTVGLALGSGPAVYSVKLFQQPPVLKLISGGGSTSNPAAAATAAIAFDSDGDPLGSGDPGHQIFVGVGGALQQVTHDPSGTSRNPALSDTGTRLTFESAGNLTGGGMVGIQQIYFRDANGGLVQVSRGQGTSSNSSLSRTGSLIVFQSTSDPANGNDTGISQIWLSSTDPSSAHAVTAGHGPSRNPLIATGGRMVVFESDADLANGGADTGVPQVFAYDTVTGNFAQVTQETNGCTGPTARKHSGDWRIAFTCNGEAFYHELRADRRLRLPIQGGNTSRAVTGIGYYFLTVSTTANLLSSGTTSGHEIYLLNLFKRPADLVSGKNVVWFPARGLSPVH